MSKADPDSGQGTAIAVVGMAVRVPGAATADEFWRNLRAGLESVTVFGESELVEAGVSLEVVRRPDYVRAKPVLDAIDGFDADFFRLSPREAALTDPQHRIFLESALEALEDAGHNPRRHPGRIGVFAAAGKNTYLLSNLLGQTDWALSDEVFQLLIGNEKDYLATRVAYLLGLTGPAITVQTACSSSLVAVHLACQSLALGECDLALAGGVSVDVPRVSGYVYRPHGILSPDGHCRPFDAAAAGTLFGQGAGVVVLRRVADAVEDRNTVRALIRGSAVNNDGARRAGFTAPSEEGQAEVVAEAMAVAEIDPDDIGYVEAHGTATPLGDAIEVRALARVFGPGQRASCAIGSVKANVGHLGAAAGVVGLVKVILSLQHREVPPTPLYRTPNPQLGLSSTRFFVNTVCCPWPGTHAVRRAGVSSFGQGGTNVHLVVEEAPPSGAAPAGKQWQFLTVSARTPAAREEAAFRLAAALRSGEHVLADVAYTLHVGRQSFEYRRVVACRTAGEAVAAIEANDPAHVADSHRLPGARPVVVLLPPFGVEEFEFPAALEAAEPRFREAIQECLRAYPPLAAALAWSGTRVFATRYALVKLLSSWGVTPDAVLGGGLMGSVVSGASPLREALAAANGDLDGGISPDLPAGCIPLVVAPVKGAPPVRVAGAGLVACGSDPAQVLGLLWLHGAAFDRAAYYKGEARRRVPLPVYPFQRRRHWVDAGPTARSHIAVPPEPLGTATEDLVAEVFRSILGVDPVDRDADFFALGGNSFLAIQLVSRIAAATGITLRPDVLYDHPTVAALAGTLRPTGQDAADWARILDDIWLDEDVSAAGRCPGSTPPPEHVLLTGATGFYGSHILEEILRSTPGPVECIVRADGPGSARERLVRALAANGIPVGESFARVRVIPGDLERPRFGLPDAEYDRLAREVYSVVHSAARVDFVQNYPALRRANIDATREVLRFAATSRVKHVHHISSVAVFDAEPFRHRRAAAEDDDLSGNTGFRTGYDLTKWVSERIIEIARSRGLPVSIYRLSNVAGHSVRGVMSYNNILVRFVEGCIQLGLAPEGDDIINVIPADSAARMLVALASLPRLEGSNFHIVNPVPARLSDLLDWLTEQGYVIRRCPEDEWRDELRRAGSRNAFGPFLPILSERSLFSNREYDWDHVRVCLGGDVKCPPFDHTLFTTYLAYLTRVSYLPRP